MLHRLCSSAAPHSAPHGRLELRGQQALPADAGALRVALLAGEIPSALLLQDVAPLLLLPAAAADELAQLFEDMKAQLGLFENLQQQQRHSDAEDESGQLSQVRCPA